MIINTPNNPTGKVFSRDELGQISALCVEFDVVAITDEIYEHILFDDAEHISIASLEGMRERTVIISGLSKSYSVTGWRIGYTLAAPELTAAIRKVHDFLTVGAAAPLQEAGAVALAFDDEYYAGLAEEYRAKRNAFLPVLADVGFKCNPPRGAYYVMADGSEFDCSDDVALSLELVKNAGVAVVPGSSFFSKPSEGKDLVRFCFCKKSVTLQDAAERLYAWSKSL